MAKQRIDVTIDQDIWFYYRANKINVSSVVNDLLRMKMDIKENNKDINKVQEELNSLSESIKEQNKARDELYIQLVSLKEQQAQQEVTDKQSELERVARVRSMAKTFRRNVMR